jgi:GTP-binding protein
MEHMTTHENQTRLIYTMPSRGLIGFNTEFMTLTKGYGILSHYFIEYRMMEVANVGQRTLGVLVSMAKGAATAYSIGHLEDRGIMFIEPGAEVYEGMIVGECNKDLDLAINPVTAKQQTNTRSATKDLTVVLKKPRSMSLEACLEYINDDELVEVTPKSMRLRKILLSEIDRKRKSSELNC